MIKIDTGYSSEGIPATLTNLALQHYDRLHDGVKRFNSPRSALISFKHSRTDRDERAEIDILIENLKSLITSPIIELKRYIIGRGDYTARFKPAFVRGVLSAFRYEAFRNTPRALEFYNGLKIKACPFCNGQFVIGLKKDGKVLGHFDHIYPKDKYPYLSVSYFNLIPCCSYCNQFKSNKDFSTSVLFTHPFDQSFASKFRFVPTTAAIASFNTRGSTSSKDENIIMKANEGHEDCVEFHDKSFFISSLHNAHHDLVDEIYLKALIYNKSNFEELKSRYVDELHLFTVHELERAVYGTYLQEEDINKRPFSKLTQDLLQEFARLRSDGIIRT